MPDLSPQIAKRAYELYEERVRGVPELGEGRAEDKERCVRQMNRRQPLLKG